LAFEEAPEQIMRNMRSIGINLEKWVKDGSLRFHAARPASFGLEVLISTMLKMIDEFSPDVVVLDPISSFDTAGTLIDARSMVMRMIDHLKAKRITVMLTSLTPGGESPEQSGLGISSLVDTWVTLRNVEIGYERTRSITILKSRGTKHSNRVREFLLTDHGIDLQDVYEGPAGTLVGAARDFDERRERRGAEAVAEGKRTAARALANQKSTPQGGVQRRGRDA
jgi:circadian clock protein KaiC